MRLPRGTPKSRSSVDRKPTQSDGATKNEDSIFFYFRICRKGHTAAWVIIVLLRRTIVSQSRGNSLGHLMYAVAGFRKKHSCRYRVPTRA